MKRNSLRRKIEYYFQKQQVVKDDIEKRNIKDIIETAEFDLTFEEKRSLREKRKLEIEKEYLIIDISDIKFKHNIR